MQNELAQTKRLLESVLWELQSVADYAEGEELHRAERAVYYTKIALYAITGPSFKR